MHLGLRLSKQHTGGLDSLERGVQIAMPTSGLNQLTESVQKAACLQLMHKQQLIPRQPYLLLLKASPDQMTLLIRDPPVSLKGHTIQIQDHLRAAPLGLALRQGSSFTAATISDSFLTWLEVAQELTHKNCLVGVLMGDLKTKATIRGAKMEGRVRKPPKKFFGLGPSLEGVGW